MILSKSEIQELQTAKNLLENPGLAARITNLVGIPIEKGFELLPTHWNQNIGDIAQTALLKASETAIFTIKDIPGRKASNISHKLGAALSGGVGGFFGLTAIAIELPISTTIMLRSIADVARSEGESINAIQTKMACLEVFALGGKSESDDGAESGYFVVRSALAKSITDATEFITQKGVTEEAAPILIRLIAKITERFGIQVTEKTAAQAIPAIGAAGGAIINTLFIGHFQNMARGHFIVRKLEQRHGQEKVKQLYDSLPKNS